MLDSLRADAVFSCRQLARRKTTSAAAILSLALAMGACIAAFRLIDALLLRPLPIAAPERLYILSREVVMSGGSSTLQGWSYADFRRLRDAVKGQAELIGSFSSRMDLRYGSSGEMEKANVQYVSGWMFRSFGLRPALGRLVAEDDDLAPGAHPIAVLSYDYWTRRFARDPKILGSNLVMGRRFGIGNDIFEIVGVTAPGFTGTEPGMVADIFAPAMMSALMPRPEASWIKAFVYLQPGVAPEPVRDRLRAAFQAFSAPPSNQSLALLMEPAATGDSGTQKDYRRPLAALGLLVALVLLIACANVMNLATAQAASRAREMAVRISIGAGRWRLVQLVLVESVIVALLATAAGAWFAGWSAPFVVSRINPPDNPARLSLSADWRVLGFALALAAAVTLVSGLIPALRASAVRPMSALRGGENPHSRRRLMHALIGVQAAFCFLVLFAAGLFISTFDRLSHEFTGIDAARLLNLGVVAERAEPPEFWDQITERLRATPGVASAALADWPVLDGYSFGYNSISIGGSRPPKADAWFMNVAPGWLGTMKIPLLEGRDFNAGDTSPGVALVNQAFAKQFLNGENPVGRTFEVTGGFMREFRYRIVGLVGDARYRFMREPVLPVAYVPFLRQEIAGVARARVEGNFVVRTAGASPAMLRREITGARPGFRVSSIRSQEELIRDQTVRERLLAMLGLFFAVVALLLAGVGLYGVLDYSVFQRRREIGIRMAIGARAGDIARRVTQEALAMVLAGAAAGLALGISSVRYIQALLYQAKPADALAFPALAILAVALLAALPAALRAVRIDPAATLRAE